MTEERLVLAELLEKAGEGDFLRAVAEAVLQLLMETDVEGMIGAGRYERSGERTTWRNGYRDRILDTRLGSLQLRIPKLRQGSYFPPFLEARKSSEKALIAVIQEAWIGGVSTRRVDDLVQAMGLSGISKSQVSKLCKEIDERVHAFLDRPLAGEWPYLWLDATYLKQREGGRIVAVAAIIAVAANTDGRREIVGLHIGPSEAETFWSSFLKSLTRRGLRGVKLVISDAHEGLKAAIRRVFGAGWQRCRVHWMRNALAYVPKTQQSMVAAALRQAFLQPDRPRPARRCVTLPTNCGRNGQSSPRSSTRARPMCCPISISPSSTAANCTAPTHSNGLTKKSSAAPMSSASSPMRPRSSG
jgi:transposase-like protein